MFEDFETWTREQALPLWASVGRDPDGAFYERLTLQGAPDKNAVRRVRVQFRQIYVYSAAYLAGIAPDGLAIARRAFDLVRAEAWAPDGAPGWAHLQNPDRSVCDPARDAYDQAFAFLGLAWLYRAQPDADVRAAIDDTLNFVDETLAAPHGGWRERAGEPLSLRRQNPHMHGFEAMMALYEATGERAFLDRAAGFFELFATRFYDPDEAVVNEYFEADWTPVPTERQRWEPGHMVEWVYLLREYERLSGENVSVFADNLYARALDLGRIGDGPFLADELHLSGAPSKPTRRLWPQTELVKATLVQHRASGAPELRAQAESVLSDLAGQYLSQTLDGGWRDAFTLDGAFDADHIPASTFYHLFSLYDLGRRTLRA